MKAALISATGRDVDGLDDVLRIVDDHPRPAPRSGSGDMLVRVLACALAPGDVRVLSGRTSMVQKPPAFPYVPGGDICGIVEEADAKAPFQKGDAVISMFDGSGPWGGLSEFKMCKPTHTARAPVGLSSVEAAALPSSALTAMRAADVVCEGDRVLVLGAGGGVGPFLINFCKRRGASFVAASTSFARVATATGADLVIDHNKEAWHTHPDLLRDPVDIIFDLAIAPGTWQAAATSGAVKDKKSGGRFVVFGADVPDPKAKHLGDILSILAKINGRAIAARLDSKVPKLVSMLFLEPKDLGRLVDEFERPDSRTAFRPVLAASSPLPFTREGVLRAFKLQGSRHAGGKVVVEVGSA